MARVNATDKGAEDLILVDAETGERIRWALWADPDAGEYERLVTDENDVPVLDAARDYVTEVRRHPIRLERVA
jgi:hypothetical protein